MAKRETEILDETKLAKAVKGIIAAEVEASFNDGAGLTLKVTEAGRARFIHRYTFKGRPGSKWFPAVYPQGVSLREARIWRDGNLALIAAGKDPAQEGASLDKLTFADFCRKHWTRLAPPNEVRRHSLFPERSRWLIDMTTLGGPLGPIPGMLVDKVTLKDVNAVLVKHWKGRKCMPRGRHLATAIYRVVDHHHLIERPEDDTWVNPISLAKLKGLNGKDRHFGKNHASLKYVFAPAFMRQLASNPDMSARLLEWIILTGVRLGEGSGAKWGEIDWKARTWTVPACRIKTESSKDEDEAPRDHIVPLSLGMVRVLRKAAMRERGGHKGMPCKPGDLIFPSYRRRKADGPRRSARPYSNGHVLHLCQGLAQDMPHRTVHGFRATLTAWGCGIEHRRRGFFPRDLMEACLAHKIVVAESGQRLSHSAINYGHDGGDDPYLPRRKAVMREWSAYLRGQPEPDPAQVIPEEGGNVIPLRLAA